MSSFPSLKQIFDNPAVVAAIIFCFGAGVGQIFHGIKKWADGEVDCIANWYFKNPRATVGAFIANGVGMLFFIQTGVLEPVYTAPNGWWSLLLFGFMNGFSADSALNKSLRQQWSDKERQEKLAEKPNPNP